MATLQQNIKLVIEADDRLTPSLRAAHTQTNTLFGPGSRTGLPMLANAAKLAVVGAAAVMGKALVDGLVDAGREAATFESKMVTVGSLIGTDVPAEMDTLIAKAKELGKETAFSAGQAADGMEALARAGFNTNEIMAAIGPLLDAAVAGGTDLGATATTVAGILRGFNLPATETGRIADVLTQTFTSSATTLDTLGESLKFVAPIAADAKIPLEDVAAAVGILGNNSIVGSQAGTALRTILLKLKAPTEAVRAELKDLNIELTDSNGQLLPLPTLIGNLQAGLAKLDPTRQTTLLRKLVDMEAMSGLSVLLKAGPKELRNYSSALENSLGRAAGIAADKMDTAEGAGARLNAAFNGLQLTIGSFLTPAFKELADNGLTPALNAIDDYIAKTDKWDIATDAMVTGLSLGLVPLLHTIIPNAADKAEDALRDLFAIQDNSQAIFQAIDRAGGQMQSTFDVLQVQLDGLTTSIEPGKPISILPDTLSEVATEARTTATAIGGTASAITAAKSQTHAWTQKLEALETQWRDNLVPTIQGTKLHNPQMVPEFIGELQTATPLIKAEGLSWGQKLSGSMGQYLTSDKGQNLIAGSLQVMLQTGSVTTALEESGAAMGAILGGSVGGAAGSVIGAEIGRRTMDVLSRLTLKGNPDFFEDSVASIREAFGLDEEEEPAPAEPLGKPVTTPPPPPAPPTPIEEAEGYLLDRFAKGTISKSRLIGFGGSLIRQAYTNLSATMSIPSGTKSNLWEAASNSPWMTPGFNMGMGMTLKAAHGFDGIVRRPTTILAGEAGPERVNIQPTDAGRGGMGSKQIFVTFNINALDGASVDETVERKVVPRLIRALRDASERGVDIIHDRGIIREVAV